jgi:hypothetical protein
MSQGKIPTQKELSDVDSTIVIANLLNRLILNAENSSINASNMAKRNLAPVLFAILQTINSEYSLSSETMNGLSSTLIQRLEEAQLLILSLMTKLNKYGKEIVNIKNQKWQF